MIPGPAEQDPHQSLSKVSRTGQRVVARFNRVPITRQIHSNEPSSRRSQEQVQVSKSVLGSLMANRVRHSPAITDRPMVTTQI